MTKKYKHTEAAGILIDNALPTEAEIDAMDAPALAAFLSSQGVDVGKLNSEIDLLKKQLTGKMALANARKQRFARANTATQDDLSSMSQDEFMAALIAKFGRLEEIPLAARNFKTMNREDWESLYRDHIIPRKP